MDSKINPGDDFHGFLPLGNDHKLLTAYQRAVKAIFHPDKSKRTPASEDIETIQSFARQALAAVGAKVEVLDVEDTVRPKVRRHAD